MNTVDVNVKILFTKTVIYANMERVTMAVITHTGTYQKIFTLEGLKQISALVSRAQADSLEQLPGKFLQLRLNLDTKYDNGRTAPSKVVGFQSILDEQWCWYSLLDETLEPEPEQEEAEKVISDWLQDNEEDEDA